MGKIGGQEANPVSRRGLFDRFKAKFRRQPIASATTPDNVNTKSSNLHATNLTLPKSAPLVVHAVDELPQPSTATVSSKPSHNDSDPVPSSSIVLAADTGGKSSFDCLSNSPEGSSLWEKAYIAATPKTKKWIDGFSKPNGISKSAESTQTEELIEIVREIEKRHQDHALQIQVGEKQIFWKDYAPRVISFIKAIGDIAIQFAPAPSEIIWSALKTVLQMSIAPGEEFAAILGCSEKVLSIVRRGKVYEVVYLNRANTFVPVQKDLERSLVDVYTKSLDLLAHVGQRLAEGYQHILLAIVNPGEAKDLMASLIKSETDLITVARACEVVRSADVEKHMSTVLDSLSESFMQINDGVCDLLEEAEENEILDALESFSRIDFGEQHCIRAESRTVGTGEWLLQHRKFQEWEHVPASTILWLQGTMGVGKTFLASKVIDQFLPITGTHYGHEPKDDQGLAFFYCNRGQPDLQNSLLILRSVVRQLFTFPRYSKMMKRRLIGLYHENKKNGLKLGFDACEKQILELVNLYAQTTIILDGLDECDTESRGELFEILVNLVKVAQRPVKIFFSSRREQDIVKQFRAESIIEIDANDNRDDIEKFIEKKMDEIERRGLWESISKELKSEIKSTLCKGSEGMFRWAVLQMEQLSKCQLPKEIRDRLGKLPMSLNDSYDELYKEMSDYNREMLRRAVMWVMCAYRPLSINQLLSAVRLSMNDDGESHDIEEELTEGTLHSICHHLVVPDYKRDVWKFPHASVIEYFETVHEWTMAKAHCLVAKHALICLINGYSKWNPPVFLVDDEGHRTTSHEPDPQHPLSYLQEYVREYWFRHVHALEGLQPHDAHLSRLVKCFMGFRSTLKYSSRQYRRWINHAQYDTSYRFAIHNPGDLFPSTNPHFGACAFGFYHILQDWWSVGVDISQVNEGGRDLPTIAAENGHEHLCEKLKGLRSDVSRVLCDGRINLPSEAITTYNADESTSTLTGVIETDDVDMVQLLRRSHASLHLFALASVRRTPYVHGGRANSSALPEAGGHPDVHFYGVPKASSLKWLDED
ncbi:Pfs,NACHT and WD domain protein [Trichoderma simmonsii]|uniref:Pfs,NACHT and WD domain protein n=1 Tax=Trichoderma simmonsii TaxID=1491479 RepID=A0A8G0L1L0_9HYPO|nr:Pfs,NACHT and WD domain protein [Trichoderma simmonsii]